MILQSENLMTSQFNTWYYSFLDNISMEAG